MKKDKTGLFKKLLRYVLIFACVALILNVPVTTRQAVNGVLSVRRIPLYVKVSGFLSRDYEYRALSRAITKNIARDTDKVAAIFDWITKNIKEKPKDAAVIDDHIWNIVIRGYGTDWQTADVFTTLASYAGYDSFYEKFVLDRKYPAIFLSFARINGKWHIFDVYNRKSFIGESDKSLATPYGPTYGEYLNTADKAIFEERMRRPDKQKLIPRIVYEFKKIFTRRGVEER